MADQFWRDHHCRRGEEWRDAFGAVAGKPIEKLCIGRQILVIPSGEIVVCRVVSVVVVVVFGKMGVPEPGRVGMKRIVGVRVPKWRLGETKQQTSDHAEE